MPGIVSCFICHNSDRRLRFFHVPSNSARLEEWSQLLNGMEIKSSSLVCEKHFLEEHITKNVEFHCWRLNRKAIPTLHLTEEKFGDFKMVNEDTFDKYNAFTNSKQNSKSIGTQTKSETPYTSSFANCLWCGFACSIQNMYDYVKHIRSQHSAEIESLFELTDHENPLDDTKEDQVEDEVNIEIEKIEEDVDDEANELEVDTNSLNESCVTKSDFDDGDEGILHEIEEYNFTNEFASNSNAVAGEDHINDDCETDSSQIEKDALQKMLEIGEESNNQINIETSDPSLVFYLIDLLQTFPQLWFINIFKSKEYEAAFTNFSTQFSKKYTFFMTKIELHESLIDIRDWYQKIFEEKSFNKLPFPQTEYFYRLAEFLPDKSNGKTCEFCERLFHDHVQYFAHKQLEHANAMSEDVEQTDEIALDYLKEHVNDYFRARYPLFQGGFSYRCQICDWECKKQKRYFTEHIKKHLDIRDHVCDVCGKTFVKKALFEIHRNRHFGLHKFKCLICGRDNFTNGSLLTSHRKRYHRPIEGTIEQIEQICKQRRKRLRNDYFCAPYAEGKQTYYACSCCERTYKFKSNVYKHFRIAHKEKVPVRPPKRSYKVVNGMYACVLCERKYKFRTGLYAHVRLAHDNIERENSVNSEKIVENTNENSSDFEFDMLNDILSE